MVPTAILKSGVKKKGREYFFGLLCGSWSLLGDGTEYRAKKRIQRLHIGFGVRV